ESNAVFLPTQAAADPHVYTYLRSSLSKGATVVVTSGFLAAISDSREAMALAGLAPFTLEALQGAVLSGGQPVTTEHGLDLAARLKATTAEAIVSADVSGEAIPFLTIQSVGPGTLAVLN